MNSPSLPPGADIPELSFSENISFEILDRQSGIGVYVSKTHRFGSDAILLARFSSPRARERACDLCCGCGIVSMLWKCLPRPPRNITAVDIAPQAAELLRLSVRRCALNEISAVVCDIRDAKINFTAGEFDLIACNPPYFALGTGFTSQNPDKLSIRHETQCSLNDVLAASVHMLRWKGRLCLCHRPERLTDVLSGMRFYGIEPKRIKFVCQRVNTTPWLVLIEGRKGAKAGLRVEACEYIEH